jgi:hypothetical protein
MIHFVQIAVPRFFCLLAFSFKLTAKISLEMAVQIKSASFFNKMLAILLVDRGKQKNWHFLIKNSFNIFASIGEKNFRATFFVVFCLANKMKNKTRAELLIFLTDLHLNFCELLWQLPRPSSLNPAIHFKFKRRVIGP